MLAPDPPDREEKHARSPYPPGTLAKQLEILRFFLGTFTAAPEEKGSIR